jgi:hypothetical protein
MPRHSSPLRRLTGWRHHFALALLFALQGAITLSPLLEAGEKGRLGAHAEQQGATHKYQHDEATCAVCAVRALHSSPAQGAAPIAWERQQSLAAPDVHLAPAGVVDPTTLARAPPTPG